MKIIKVSAKSTARTVSWSQLTKGEIVNQSRSSLSLSTVIPDVLDEVIQLINDINPEFNISILKPNGFTSACLDFAILSEETKIMCSRRLVRGFFPFNPIAAEFGGNYDIIFSISTNDDIMEKLLSIFKNYSHEEASS